MAMKRWILEIEIARKVGTVDGYVTNITPSKLTVAYLLTDSEGQGKRSHITLLSHSHSPSRR